MKHVPYRCLILLNAALAVVAVPSEAAVTPEARPTFHCIGLYWSPSDGAVDNPCTVRYRQERETLWHEALPLWFDDTEHPDMETMSYQYRGSIVNLLPGTEYEILLTLERTGTQATLAVATWSEQFRVKAFVPLDAGLYNAPLHITQGGSAQDGYVVYSPPDGSTAVIDVGNRADYCLRVDASYVIIRGLTCIGSRRHGILLRDVTDVVIEDCDISGWGRVGPDGFGINLDSAIYSESPQLERIVVQRCRLHDPRSNASAWTQGGHPLGAHAICWKRSKGWHVIRYNEMYSDERHCFNDIMGSQQNHSFGGFPNRDSDIYCNFLANCRDDGIESEGANMNVRIWSNYVDAFYMAIGASSTSLGPQYIWRNCSGFSRRGPTSAPNYYRGGAFLKMGVEDPQYAQGRICVFHNTILQPPAPWAYPEREYAGCESGLNITGSSQYQSNIVSRNNILHVNNYTGGQDSIKDRLRDPSNDFDFDMFNGFVVAGSEPNGIRLPPDAVPPYVLGASLGGHALAAGAPGYDAAERIANFNDRFAGRGPDMGACENAGSALPIGVEADWTAWLVYPWQDSGADP